MKNFINFMFYFIAFTTISNAQINGTYQPIINISIDTLLYNNKADGIASEIDYLRYGIVAPFNITDTSIFKDYPLVYPKLQNLYFYNSNWSCKMPDNFSLLSRLNLIFITNSTFSTSEFWNYSSPNLYINTIQFLGNANLPSTILPANWSNLLQINNLTFQRCRLTTAQVNSLITQIDVLANAGMGSQNTAIHNVYFNGTGTYQNQAATPSILTGLGYVLTAGYYQKTILTRTWRIYVN